MNMKHWKKVCVTFVTAAVLSIGSCCLALAADGGIHVSGVGVVQADPDTAAISIGVERTGKTAQAAQKDTNKLVEKVTAAMKELGIAEQDITTTYTYVYPTYTYDEETGARSISGYRSETDLQITTKDIDNSGKYIDAALAAGATNIGGVTFSLSDQSVAYAQALQLAAKNANTSAQAIAAAFGKPLGAVSSVSEVSSNVYTVENATLRMAVADSAADTAGGTDISYGKIEVRANLSVSYAF